MNHHQISAILPPLNQDERQEHYIDQQSFKNSQFQSSIDHSKLQQPEQLIYQSTLHSKLYYAKKIMKQLLNERSKVCDFLKIRPSKNIKNRQQQQQNRQKIIKILKKIFQDSPSQINQLCTVNIRDCMATYTFFSSDGKFVPLCKLCNESAYTVTRDKYCKIVCSNLKSEYYETEKHLKNDNLIITEKSEISSKKSSISRSSKTINAERKYTKQEMVLIKKTAKKIIYQ